MPSILDGVVPVSFRVLVPTVPESLAALIADKGGVSRPDCHSGCDLPGDKRVRWSNPFFIFSSVPRLFRPMPQVELATQLARGEFILAFVCGVLSATGLTMFMCNYCQPSNVNRQGGGILGDAFQLYNTNWGLRTPSAFSELSSRIVLPMIASNLYTLSTYVAVVALSNHV